MNRTDKIISAILLGLPVPTVLMLIFWWVSVPIFKDNDLMYFLLVPAGFIIGVVLDLTILRKFMLRLFSLTTAKLFFLLTFYTLILYGFFMGFPVFNSLVGVLGVYIITRSGLLKQSDRDALQKNQRKMILFASILLLLICIATTVMALNQESIELELKLMLDLPFEVTTGMVWALILIGAVVLLSLQYGLSKLVYYIMLKKHPQID